MHTIALISQKGGVGKTTLSLHLAVSMTLAGRNVALLDLDPQASAAEWGDIRESEFPHVQSIQPSRLHKTLEQMRDIGADIVILDTAPHSEATSLDAARVADLVIVHCKPSIMDLRAMTKTIDLLKLVKVPAYAILNGVQHHSLAAAEEAAITIQTHLGMNVAPLALGERVAFNRCLITGQAAQETDPDSKAAQEVEIFREWVERTLPAAAKRKAA
jgi:chromosome partitioning protein